MTFQNQSGQGVSAPSGNQKPVDKGCLLPVDTSFIGKFMSFSNLNNYFNILEHKITRELASVELLPHWRHGYFYGRQF